MNHTPIHYAIGAVAILLAGGSGLYVNHRVDSLPAQRVQHFAWPGLSDAQETALTAAMAKLGPHDVTVWCLTANCTDLAEDLQYVAYQAGWDTHSDIPIIGQGVGLRVSPDDATGKALAAAISNTMGLPVGTEPGPTINGKPVGGSTYNIILGAK